VAILSDLRYALRVAARKPAVPTLVATMFALSVGLAGGLWAVIDAVALRPLPYREGDRLVVVLERHPERGSMFVTPANFLDWIDRVSTLQDVAGSSALEANLIGRDAPVRVIGSKVTDRFFDLLGIAPLRGRTLGSVDFRGDGRGVVLHYQLWQRQFHGDPNVVGSPVVIDGESYTVVGVMPREFKTIGHAEFWIPWIMSPEERGERRFHLVGVMARLRNGRGVADAQRELESIYGQLRADHPDTARDWTAWVRPLRDVMLGDSRRALLLLGAATATLILVASVNIAGLLLAWLPSRRQELMVRLAIGASARRVAGQLLAETATWAIAGSAAGVALAAAFVRLFGAVAISPALEFDFEPGIDARVIAATIVLLVSIVGATAVVPCLLAVGRARDLVPRRAAPSGRVAHRIAIAAQVAMCVALLCTTATLLASFRQVASLASRNPSTAVGLDISLPENRYRDEPAQRDFFDRLLANLATRSELQAVAAASYVPPARISGNVRFEIEGRSTPSDAQTTLLTAVSSGIFNALGVSLVRGRLIDDRDAAAAPRIGVISTALARRYWPNDDPIGHRITLVGDTGPIMIVGLVDLVRQPLSADPRAESVLYLPYRQFPLSYMTLIVVPARDVAPALAAVREETARLDPAQALGAARPLDQIRGEWLEQPRLQTRIVTLFGLCTLLLTLVGLYARVAYAAASRSRELAIRQAIGAAPTHVVRVLTAETVVVVLGGVSVGLAMLPMMSSLVQTTFGPVSSIDVNVPAVVAALFGVAAFGSAYWPARRAARVDAAAVLRSE
jgi:putative ABC transport system permease protein